MAFLRMEDDEALKNGINKAAKKVYYEQFCELFNNTKRDINNFFVMSNKAIAKYRSAKPVAQKEIFTDIENLYIDNKIYYENVMDSIKNQYVSKNISDENLDSFKRMKSDLNRTLKEYKEVLDGIENGIKNLDKNIDEKIEQEKQRRKEELEAEKKRIGSGDSKNSSDDEFYQSTQNSHDDPGAGGIFGWGIGPF